MCLFAFPRSASEVNPEKREFLRGNAGLVGEILGPFILHWKFKQLTWRIIIEILTWVSPRICPDIFTKEDQRLPIYDVAWLFVVGLACFLFWTFRSQFVICFLEASAYAAGFPCTPYSLLSCTRKMLHDQNARQLFRVIKRLRRYRPKASWINYAIVSSCLSLIVARLYSYHTFFQHYRLQLWRMSSDFVQFLGKWYPWSKRMCQGNVVALTFDLRSILWLCCAIYGLVRSQFVRYEISSHILTPCLGSVVNTCQHVQVTYKCSPILFIEISLLLFSCFPYLCFEMFPCFCHCLVLKVSLFLSWGFSLFLFSGHSLALHCLGGEYFWSWSGRIVCVTWGWVWMTTS